MACEGRARNRMLRKRWIVRNPVVGEEDDVTQLILTRSFNTPMASWSPFPPSVMINNWYFLLKAWIKILSQTWTHIWRTEGCSRLLFALFRRKVTLQVSNTMVTQLVLSFKQHLLRHGDPRMSLIVIWLFSAHLIWWKQALFPKHRGCYRVSQPLGFKGMLTYRYSSSSPTWILIVLFFLSHGPILPCFALMIWTNIG